MATYKSCKLEKIRIINEGMVDDTSTIPSIELSRRLIKVFRSLKGKFIKESGKGVDYDQMKQSKEFKEFGNEALNLQLVDLSSFSETEKKVFFINVYNSLVIHGLVTQPTIPTSVLSVQHFFKSVAYKIGGFALTLDDIEHGILRNNRPHPSFNEPQFDSTDERVKLICDSLDPRIHFALVCGAKSCPAINVYTPENIEKALDAAAQGFISQEVLMDNETNEVFLSKLFQWYQTDFGETEGDLLSWMMPYLSQAQSNRCSTLLQKLKEGEPVTIKYTDYNWGINNVTS